MSMEGTVPNEGSFCPQITPISQIEKGQPEPDKRRKTRHSGQSPLVRTHMRRWRSRGSR